MCVCVGFFFFTSKDLVEKDFDMVGAEGLWRHDDLMEVALHQLRHHIATLGA